MVAENKINLLDPKELEKLSKGNSPKQFAMMSLSMKLDKYIKTNFVVDSTEKAIYMVNDYLKDSPNEVIIGIAFNSSRQPTCCCVLGLGDEGHVDINIKNTFKFALASGGDSFILVHNHPTANELKLSNGDLSTINEIQTIATKLGIRFRDFIVVGNEKQNRAYYSWYEKGVITQYDFIKRIGDFDKLEKPIGLDNDPERTIDEVNELLAESKYNSPDSIVEPSKEKSSKGFFGMFK